jgi:hypothetical protein
LILALFPLWPITIPCYLIFCHRLAVKCESDPDLRKALGING